MSAGNVVVKLRNVLMAAHPFLAHLDGCQGPPCTCGLTELRQMIERLAFVTPDRTGGREDKPGQKAYPAQGTSTRERAEARRSDQLRATHREEYLKQHPKQAHDVNKVLEVVSNSVRRIKQEKTKKHRFVMPPEPATNQHSQVERDKEQARQRWLKKDRAQPYRDEDRDDD